MPGIDGLLAARVGRGAGGSNERFGVSRPIASGWQRDEKAVLIDSEAPFSRLGRALRNRLFYANICATAPPDTDVGI